MADRELLGKVVRKVWLEWAHEQPNPKPSWLLPWDSLAEPDKEVDRRIGETIASFVLEPMEQAVATLTREREEAIARAERAELRVLELEEEVEVTSIELIQRADRAESQLAEASDYTNGLLIRLSAIKSYAESNPSPSVALNRIAQMAGDALENTGVESVEAQPAEARGEAERLRAHLENGMSIVSRAAGFIAGVLDENGGDSSDDPQVIGCLRWEIEARRLLGLPLEIIGANDESPWAKAMRAALNPPTEGQKE